MTDFASMSARELRSIAPSYGVTGASRMKKDELVAALSNREVGGQYVDLGILPLTTYEPTEEEMAEAHQPQRIGTRVTNVVDAPEAALDTASFVDRLKAALKPRSKALVPSGSFDRAARDALKRQPVVIYDPAGEIDEKQYGRRAARNRDLRRHRYSTVMLLDGGRTTKRKNLPKIRREAGLMKPATWRDVAKGRAALVRAS